MFYYSTSLDKSPQTSFSPLILQFMEEKNSALSSVSHSLENKTKVLVRWIIWLFVWKHFRSIIKCLIYSTCQPKIGPAYESIRYEGNDWINYELLLIIMGRGKQMVNYLLNNLRKRWVICVALLGTKGNSKAWGEDLTESLMKQISFGNISFTGDFP